MQSVGLRRIEGNFWKLSDRREAEGEILVQWKSGFHNLFAIELADSEPIDGQAVQRDSERLGLGDSLIGLKDWSLANVTIA